MNEFENIINKAWDERDQVSSKSDQSILDAVSKTIDQVDSGKIRVAEKKDGEWVVHQWIKKAILLSFRINEMQTTPGPYATWWDKVKGKTAGWGKEQHLEAGFRMVPNAVIRYGSHVGKNVVVMPSFINIGAFVDEGTMVDTWVTVGSCAQVGKNCHLSGGVGIGGVLEPMQANPTIIEDNCFIGARSEIVEGVIVGEGSVVSMGVFIGQSTKIVHRDTGEIIQGKIPPYSVVVPGSLPAKDGKGPSLYCAVIIKQVDEKTRSKTSINDLLRE
jgi:2,3,4,5-tetrahydropyridine-2-carboxylate N-succinyltransferase